MSEQNPSQPQQPQQPPRSEPPQESRFFPWSDESREHETQDLGPAPHQGYGAPGSPEPAAAHPRRRWPWAVAGGLAGAVLAASVAVPTALYVDRASSESSEAQADAPAGTLDPATGGDDGAGGTDGTDEGTVPDQLPEELPEELPDDFPDAGDPFGGFGGAQEGLSSGTAATDAQSRGVVLIETTVGTGTQTGTGAGTGMVLSADGLVLTNYHVVEDSSEVEVTLAGTGEQYTGEVVGYQEAADVALVQLADAEGLETVELDDDGTDLQEEVAAIGNAWGQGSLSVVTGTILAEEESITTGERGQTGGDELTGLIQTNAAVVSGYSGGPLVDAQGEVVGINTAASFDRTFASTETSSESYAVPIDDALAIVELIEDGDESGPVTIGPAPFLGISIADVDTAQVAGVEQGGPAAEAGLAAGDTITALEGARITSYDVLVAALADYEPGQRVTVTWTGADGGEDSAEIELGASPVN